MTNKKSQKDQLAKLMATENLTIVHKKVPTAYFDMKNRILCCPIFKDDLSDELYDLFMGHEVGHALNTPYEGVHSALTKNRTLKGYLNVVEDVRIEKAIKNKYPGLRKSFFKAYDELMGLDFFGIKSKDVNGLSLIDKINLITKVGSRVNITLNSEEAGFLQMAEDCVTWEDVEECANAIYNWSKENETRDSNDESIIPQTLMIEEDDMEQDDDGNFEDDGGDFESEEGDDGYGDGDEGEEDDDNLPDNIPTDSAGDPAEDDNAENEAESDNDSEGEEGEDSSTDNRKTTGREGGNSQEWSGSYDDENGARESITEHHAHNNEEQFLSEDNIVTSTILLKEQFEKENHFKDIVIGFKAVNKDWENFWNPPKDSYRTQEDYDMMRAKAQHSSKKLRDKNKKVVAHMAKEFEMKQTAMRSIKAFQGKTGKLDMNKLAKYQIVDDIFRKVTMIPDGKNHGIQIMLDWSGSIGNECSDLIEQCMILVDFCRKVQIPHRVYLFSDCYQETLTASDEWRAGETKLIEMFSDKQSSKDFLKAHLNFSHLWNHHYWENRRFRKFQAVVDAHNEWYGDVDHLDYDEEYGGWFDMPRYWEPRGYNLGGTPLDHTLTAMRVLIPEFTSEYGIEKSILTVITDGYSHRSSCFSQSDSEREEMKEQQDEDGYYWRSTTKRYMIDPYHNKSYLYHDSSCSGNGSFNQTQNILEWISAETGCIVTGYFVLGRKQDLWEMKYNLPAMDVDSTWRQIRKEGVAVNCKGYNKLFLTSTSALSVAGDSELDDELVGANKRKLLGAFKRNQKSKTTSRFLTNEFIKEIA